MPVPCAISRDTAVGLAVLVVPAVERRSAADLLAAVPRIPELEIYPDPKTFTPSSLGFGGYFSRELICSRKRGGLYAGVTNCSRPRAEYDNGAVADVDNPAPNIFFTCTSRLRIVPARTRFPTAEQQVIPPAPRLVSADALQHPLAPLDYMKPRPAFHVTAFEPWDRIKTAEIY
ncbi:hypothetical protein B0H17DRAFT_1137720 [Mycena rosella]|uniref:Uncharacterized protein n=1 Tax=Mycena rosella TaxID=1033263 RepID=A0AAD7D869_MYCRO|nr:hypothetical protein B0H17DRAFT_1137720 [Mycena rosella]